MSPDWSWTEYGRGLAVDAVRLWTDCGCGQFAAAAVVVDWTRSRTDCGRDSDADWLRTGRGHGHGADADWLRTGRQCGQDDNADIGVDFARLVPGQRADIARTQKPHFDEE